MIRRLDVHDSMEIPKVGPLGLIDHPDGYVARARSYPPFLRATAGGVLGWFLTVTYSLGAYCLTTWAGSPFALTGLAAP